MTTSDTYSSRDRRHSFGCHGCCRDLIIEATINFSLVASQTALSSNDSICCV